MNIIGGDFNLKKDKDNYILYIMNKNGKAKLAGYFTHPLNAFRWVKKWRQEKKYPHKESAKDIIIQINRLKKIQQKHNEIAQLIYNPITKLNNEVNGIRGVYDKLGSKDRFNTGRTRK